MNFVLQKSEIPDFGMAMVIVSHIGIAFKVIIVMIEATCVVG